MRNAILKIAPGLTVTVLLMTQAPVKVYGQFYQFSQYYNTFQLLNPAFVGSSGNRYKVNFNSRLQWRNISENSRVVYRTSAVSTQWIFGHPLSENGNVKNNTPRRGAYFSMGLSLISNNQGDGSLKSSSILVSPAVLVRLGERSYLSGGIEFSVNRYKLNNYILVDSYLDGSYTENSAIVENSSDLSTGIILTVGNYWIGGSLKDMTTRPVSNDGRLVERSGHFYDNVYIHGGTSFAMREEGDLFFTSSFSFKKRRQSRQFEVGAGFIRAYQSGYSWSATAAYRGFGKNEDGLKNWDAAILVLGFNIPPGVLEKKKASDKQKDLGILSINISSDFLHTQFSDPFRTWEVSLILNAPSRKGSQNQYKSYCEDSLHGPFADQITRNLFSKSDASRRPELSDKPYSSDKKRKRRRPKE